MFFIEKQFKQFEIILLESIRKLSWDGMDLNLSIILILLAVGALSAAVSSAAPDGESAISGITMIHAIQGDGPSSQMQDEMVAVEAIVTGNFQGRDMLRGFFVQEEDSDTDDNIKTSEGLFVFDPGGVGYKENISRGDLVMAEGYIEEFHGLTELNLKEIKKVDRNSIESTVTAQQLVLPREENSLEGYEGMLLLLPQELVITDTENFSEYGELHISPRARLPIPTNVVQPGTPAARIQELNNRSTIILDDGSGQTYPDSYPFPKTVRCGDTYQGITGILSYSHENYKLEPLNISEIIISNPRPIAPEPVGGRLRIASMNLENYFNGDGVGGGFPGSRGARSKEEFQLQRNKIIQAITDMKADVIGVIEVENDGYGSLSAIHDLTDGLNAIENGIGLGNYSFVDPGSSRLGDDLISVGLIYNRTLIRPVGRAATMSKGAISGKRQPLAQTFEEISTKERFTVVVVHLKSKNPPGGNEVADGDNGDLGDGQGYWNGDRTRAADELVRWLSSDPTGSQDPDYLIIGDMNSYRYEDPIRAFEKGGYKEMIDQQGTIYPYSYEYKGQWGLLDHMLASSSLAGQVTGTSIWHINADESSEFAYNGRWSSPDVYRSSDHDPLIAGISLS